MTTEQLLDTLMQLGATQDEAEERVRRVKRRRALLAAKRTIAEQFPVVAQIRGH